MASQRRACAAVCAPTQLASTVLRGCAATVSDTPFAEAMLSATPVGEFNTSSVVVSGSDSRLSMARG